MRRSAPRRSGLNEVRQCGQRLLRQCVHRTSTDSVVRFDLDLAHDCIVGSELVRDQFKTVLPKLRDKLTAALESERHARWPSTYRNAKTERDALAREFADTYPAMVSQLVDLFDRMQQCDQKCAEVNSTASALQNEHRRLSKVELNARNLDGFGLRRVSPHALARANLDLVCSCLRSRNYDGALPSGGGMERSGSPGTAQIRSGQTAA
jgi:hypothetical protein